MKIPFVGTLVDGLLQGAEDGTVTDSRRNKNKKNISAHKY